MKTEKETKQDELAAIGIGAMIVFIALILVAAVAAAAAAVAAGADGLIIEVHPDPQNAASDGGQTLDFGTFEKTMETCRRVAQAVGRNLL